jgi:hypothetical protein
VLGRTAGCSATARSAGTHSAAAAAATSMHALRRRQADAGEQRCCGEQEPIPSHVAHRNLLRLAHGFTDAVPLERRNTRVRFIRVFRSAGENEAPKLFVPVPTRAYRHEVMRVPNRMKLAGDEASIIARPVSVRTPPVGHKPTSNIYRFNVRL